MKEHILQALKLTFVTLIFFCIIYPLIVWGIAQFIGPNHAEGEKLEHGYVNIGQKFTLDKYFWSRPSAVGYNAAGSGGSNKGPSNPEYLAGVEKLADTFLLHNPGVKREEIPSELVTASGSGLDPDLSPAAARIQVQRIAKVRDISCERLLVLVERCTETPFHGLFGLGKVNVLKLNLELDKMK
jgi:potassium-transporting ATPase KdpC subunit